MGQILVWRLRQRLVAGGVAGNQGHGQQQLVFKQSLQRQFRCRRQQIFLTIVVLSQRGGLVSDKPEMAVHRQIHLHGQEATLAGLLQQQARLKMKPQLLEGVGVAKLTLQLPLTHRNLPLGRRQTSLRHP